LNPPSSLISEWRRFRDAGVLAGKQPGEKIGRLTAEQAEIARLRRQLEKAERTLATTEAALGVMGRQPLRLAVRLNFGCETSI